MTNTPDNSIDDNNLIFANNNKDLANGSKAHWKIMIVDDEANVHQATKLVLKEFTFNGKSLAFISAYSGEEAKRLLKAHPDTATILLDVVMEEDNTGLEVVEYVRDVLGNKLVRIIICTGQPGKAPEESIIKNYDIDDYKLKTDLTLKKLSSAIVTALRSFQDLTEIETHRQELENLYKNLTEKNVKLKEANERLQQEIIERKRVEEKIKRRNHELALLNQVTAASATNLEPETVLEIVCNELAQLFNIYQVRAGLLNDDKTAAVIVAEYWAEGKPAMLKNIISVADSPSFQYLLAHKTPLIVNDVQNDPRLASTRSLTRLRNTVSMLVLPLIIEGEVVGGLSLSAVETHNFSTEEVNLAQNVANQVAGALTQARLTQTRQRLTTAIEQTAEGIIITDTQGIIMYVNPAFEQITGYSRAEAIGRNPRFLKSGKHSVTFYRDLWTTLTAGQVWQGRIVNKKKNGTLYTEEATISPIRDEGENIISYVALKRDVTRELELEAQLHQSQKMKAIGQLAGGIAHDFNNLLTAIMGYAGLALETLPVDNPLHGDIQGIQKNAERAADLTGQLLAFARRQITEPRILNLNNLILDMDKMLRRLISEDIELVTLPALNLGAVKIDPVQFEQVLVNLVINARDAMPDGGKLTIETANASLQQNYTDRHPELIPGEYIMLSVSDNGVGMSNETQTHIFEPFFTTKEMGKGTGLGLATCFGIVKQNNGHIWVYSKVGQGTTFKIYLPCVKETAGARVIIAHPGGLPQGTETILLAEDEPSVRRLAARILRRQGYTVLEAINGEEAMRLVQEYEGEIHLLFTDVVMPQMGGKRLADWLRETRPNAKILFTSGYTDNAIIHHGMLDAGLAFLQKPFAPATLAHKVRSALDSQD